VPAESAAAVQPCEVCGEGHGNDRLCFFETQQQFAQAVFSGAYRYLLFGGAIRGGKSYVSIGLILALAKIFPGSRWAIVRKDLPTLKRNTIPTFEKIAPRPFCGRINRSDWTVKCANGSEIIFFPESLKQDQDLDRWKGLEVNGFALEEANELSEASFNKSIERAGSWTSKGEHQPPPLVLLTCNPARNWVYRSFYLPWRDGTLEAPYYYLPSRPADNPTLTAEYLESLEQLKDRDAATYKRFVRGDWEQDTDPRQLTAYEWCLAACDVEPEEGIAALGVDVARFGGDDTTMAHKRGNRLHRLEQHSGLSIDKTAALVELRINRQAGDTAKGEPEWLFDVDPVNVKVDSVGLGAGVVDILHGEGLEVREVVGGARPIPRAANDDGRETSYKFANLRSQLWWEAREAFRTGAVCVDLPPGRRRNELFEDLCAPRYEITGDKVIRVESKDATKARLGRSPDKGDAFVYAWAELEAVEPEWVIA
jgi:hypothetical protein